MSGSCLQEIDARRALKEAMDCVADCDGTLRELVHDEAAEISVIQGAIAALEDAWKDWVSAYCRWVELHAANRVDEVRQWFPCVNKE